VARIASVALVAAIVVNLLYVAAMLDYADAIQTELNGSGISVEEAEEVEQTVSDTSLAYLAAMFAGAIGFLVWFQRAYRNCAHLTGRPLRYGVGWSIGAWFIPIFNLWRPKQIANDVWRGGDAAARNNPEWNSLRVSTAVHWWWLAWVLASVVAAVGSGLISPDTVLSDAATGLDVGDATLDQEHAAAVILAASGALSVIAGVMAIVFVRRASERQDARIAATAV